MSLLEAREKRHSARKLLLDGKDPAAGQKVEDTAAAQREETAFAAYADIYIDRLAKVARSEPTLKSQQLCDVTRCSARAVGR